MTPEIIVLLIFVGLFVGIFFGFPTAFVLGGLSMIFGFLFIGPEVFGFFIVRLEGTMQNYTLLAVPLFLFMGVFMEKSGVAERLFNALYIWCGRLRGGLGVSTIVMAMLFAATTGIVGASEVTIGLIALPAMLAKNYDKRLACGSICAGGTLGILIPPSVMIIIYGPIANISVGKLFMGAYLPGIFLGFLYIAYILIRCYFRPQDGPPIPEEEGRIPMKRKIGILLTSIMPIALVVFAVLGSILFGVAAVTEAGAVGAISSMFLAALYGNLSLKLIREACIQTLKITSMIMLIAVMASFFSTVFVALKGDDVISNLLKYLPLGRWGILICIMLLLIVLGALIDWMSIIFIAVPIITPIAQELGFDPLWFALMVIVNLQISFLSPPFAYSIFYLKGITPPEVTTTHIYQGVVPFVGLQVAGLILCILFPGMLTFLPSLMVK
ncbi:MAG: TRAP transporter large permease subunit [Deltaproteobacteria bacterium]|nr:MAG: TRAP transporter large permease subunit [Deltaproteobacteria bacterium]